MHFYGWKKGLKTGMYYLRTRAAADAIKFTVDQQKLSAKNKRDDAGAPCKPPLVRDIAALSDVGSLGVGTNDAFTPADNDDDEQANSGLCFSCSC